MSESIVALVYVKAFTEPAGISASSIQQTVIFSLSDRQLCRAVSRLEAPDKQISLTDPNARSMATSGRGTGMVGYNVQTAVDTEHHLIVAHEVTNVGNDRGQLLNMAKQAQEAIEAENLQVVAYHGYFKGEETLAGDKAGTDVTLPKPQTSGAQAEG